jgi:hypothetical protein
MAVAGFLRRASLVALAAGSLVLPAGAAGGAPADGLHRPDLRTLRPRDLSIQVLGAVKELRLSNTIWNAGPGPLELRPENAAGVTTAYQRIYSHDAGENPYLAQETAIGTFAFHQGHGHWHLEDFALYEILEVTAGGGVGGALRQGEKVSFCIIPTTFITSNVEHAGWGGAYTCGENGVQGLPVGWGDTYTSGLSGQSIDITGLPDGIYWLRSTADFEDRIDERRETNNSARLKIRITGMTVTRVR